MADSRASLFGRLMPFGGRGKGGAKDQVADEQQERLLLLFEKRNELKREFGRTLDELEALRADHEKLRQRQERDTTRLEGLEKLLTDPAECQNAVVYYRLDTLWKLCRQQLARRRAELESRYEELERKKLLEDFRAHAEQQQRELEERFKGVDAEYQAKADTLSALQAQRSRSNKPWHFFKRKRLDQEILAAEEDMAPAVAQREECLAELERVRDREPPAWKGLSVRSRREINLQLIALAQYLVVHFSENDLASLARSTQLKHPGDWRFGDNNECLAVLKPLREIVGRLKSDERRSERIQRRVNHLRETVSYAGNADTVPESACLARIAPSPGATESLNAIHADIPVNVLEAGFWGLDRELLQPD